MARLLLPGLWPLGGGESSVSLEDRSPQRGSEKRCLSHARMPAGTAADSAEKQLLAPSLALGSLFLPSWAVLFQGKKPVALGSCVSSSGLQKAELLINA